MFENYSPQDLRDAIEYEMRKTDDAKMATIIALEKLKKDPEYFMKMEKAAQPHKYYKRVPKASGKGYNYYYTKEDYQKSIKEKPEQKKKEGWIAKIAGLFGYKDRSQVMQKIQADYKEKQIGDKYGVSWDGWKDHLAEYFSNKDKWDTFFSGKKEKPEKKDRKPGEKKEKAEKKTKVSGLKLSVMKEIFSLYGNSQEPVEDSLDTMPESKKKAIDNLPSEKKETVLSDNFKNWFGDWVNNPESASKVVDKNDIPEEQKPITVFHGTARGGFTEFSKEKSQGGIYGSGFYFTEDESIAKEYTEKDTDDEYNKYEMVSNILDGNGKEIIFDKSLLTKIIKRQRDEIAEIQQKGGSPGYGYLSNNPNYAPFIEQLHKDMQESEKYNLLELIDKYNNIEIISNGVKRKPDMTYSGGKTKLIEAIKEYLDENSQNYSFEEYPRQVYDVYLSIKNPCDMDSTMTQNDLDNFKSIFGKEGITLYMDDILGYDFWEKELKKDYAKGIHEYTMNDFLKIRDKMRGMKFKEDIEESRFNPAKKKGDYVFPVMHLSKSEDLSWGEFQYIITNGQKFREADPVKETLEKMGFDGIKHTGGYNIGTIDHKVWIAFEPNQIKSTKSKGFNPMEADMFKAKDLSKLTKKVITNKKGKQQTVYIRVGEDKTIKDAWIGKFANFFGFKDRKQVIQKIQKDYIQNEIDKKYSLTWDGWKDHLAEYFNNKDKWDNFFSGNKEKKTADKKKKPSEKKEKKERKEKKSGLKLSVMKEIFSLYGGVEKVQEDNFDTMPETKGEEYERAINLLRSQDKSNLNTLLKNDAIFNIRINQLEKFKDSINSKQGLSEQDREEKLNAVNDYIKELKEMKTGKENNPEPVETPKQKKQYDKKVSKAINTATPENRFEKEREIAGIPEPKDVPVPEGPFSPVETEITVPFYKGGGPENFKALDYTNVSPKDIYLVKAKTILETEKPAYIPDIDEAYFSYSSNLVTAFKVSEDKYIIRTNSKKTVYEGRGADVKGEDAYVVVNRDVLAATQDYYIKKAKAINDKTHKEREEKYGRKIRKTRVSVISDKKMSYEQSNVFSSFVGINMSSFTDKEGRKKGWDMYHEIRNDIKQKSSDLEIQFEEYENAHSKGRETSYGDSGVKDNLLQDYGVLVKRQNGDEISDTEINEIKGALTDIFEVFGNRSSMAKNFGLKISHSGDVLMHARKAAGLFAPSMKAIGVTAKYGESGTGFILAHEFGHFMDYYIGSKENRHYASDNPEGIAGQIADTFRKNMSEEQSSKYQNRTCECFARSMEQYWAIKTGNNDLMAEWDKGNHPTEEKFKEKVMPLIDKFFTEKQEMLKAFMKKFNPETHEFEYRRV